MGGCVSRPKELDGANTVPVEKSPKPEVTVKPVEGQGNAPAEEVQDESATEPEIKEEPLVDLSESKPEAEKSEVADLAPEISELTVDALQTVDSTSVKEDAPIAEQVTVTKEKEEVVEEKAEEAKESGVVADEKV